MELSAKHQKAINVLIPKEEQQAFIDQVMEEAIQEKKASKSQSIDVYVDGGSRGNPGPAGGGFGIFKAGKLIEKGSEFFGEKTNNQAEYLALRLALREVYDKYQNLRINCFMDSQLVVNQMNGLYKVKNENIKPLHEEVRRIADQFKSFTISHVPREENTVADSLANQAMDRG